MVGATRSGFEGNEGRRAAPSRRARWVRRVTISVVLLVLPFLTLTGFSVLVYERHVRNPWLALLAGMLLTSILLAGYVAAAAHRVTGHWRVPTIARRAVVGVVVAYTLYALLYLSAGNAKGGAVRAEYGSLHPLLRVAVSTLILLDDEILITDMSRRPADYPAMGLPVARRSMHYAQADGYAYAMDLRTRGRAAWKNGLMEGYFRILGFHTLRHVGTADHLHVSLPEPQPLARVD